MNHQKLVVAFSLTILSIPSLFLLPSPTRLTRAQEPNETHVLPATYYSLRGNFASILTLNNKGPEPLEVQPTLFSLSGQRLDVPPVTVPGTSFRVIDLRQWVVPGSGFDEGSLQVVHHGLDMQLGAQVKAIDADHSLIFDEQMMAAMNVSSRLEGVWWLPALIIHRT
jgi:hypothetical protein